LGLIAHTTISKAFLLLPVDSIILTVQPMAIGNEVTWRLPVLGSRKPSASQYRERMPSKAKALSNIKELLTKGG
jgi:hypothetical protein